MSETIQYPASISFVWDDDTPMLAIMQYVFHQRGYTFQYFPSFDVAQAEWSRLTPTVAILKRSLHMRDDALTVCKQLRMDAQLAQLPIIIGYADLLGATFEEAFVAGASGCFGRVFDIDGVCTMVERLVQDPTLIGLVDQV